jgi:hypothetical protein
VKIERNCSSTISPTTKLTCSYPGLNPSLRGERPVPYCLSNGTALSVHRDVGSDTHTKTFRIDKRLGVLMSPEGGARREKQACSPNRGFLCPQYSDVRFHAHLCFPRPRKEVPYLSGSFLALVGG